jgi:hypothetical protein
MNNTTNVHENISLVNVIVSSIINLIILVIDRKEDTFRFESNDQSH